jgi:hypothetical protein
MSIKRVSVRIFFLLCLVTIPAAGGRAQDEQTQGIREELPDAIHAVIWRDPGDIASRNLFYGPGGREDAPDAAKFTFVKEDLDGTQPKFDVRDPDGVNWKVKLGAEARPETAATRLIWAVGYSADEDYFVREATIAEAPTHLRRGSNLIKPNGVLYDARLERDRQGKKIGEWRWKNNPFTGTRELNGLRAMMALINNWDLKDINNVVIQINHEKRSDDASPGRSEDRTQVYLIGDLGASFGSTGIRLPLSTARGNLKAYSHSKFIRKVTPEYVDFNVPTRPALILAFALPDFISRLKMRSIGKRIPIEDVRWIGGLLAQLSPSQIRDAFRAAGYADKEVEGYARVVESRIAELQKL